MSDDSTHFKKETVRLVLKGLNGSHPITVRCFPRKDALLNFLERNSFKNSNRLRPSCSCAGMNSPTFCRSLKLHSTMNRRLNGKTCLCCGAYCSRPIYDNFNTLQIDRLSHYSDIQKERDSNLEELWSQICPIVPSFTRRSQVEPQTDTWFQVRWISSKLYRAQLCSHPQGWFYDWQKTLPLLDGPHRLLRSINNRVYSAKT